MLTGTDETRGLEEWNVNTIAHLEPEKPHRAFLTCRVGLSGGVGRVSGRGCLSRPLAIVASRTRPEFFFLFFSYFL